MSVIKLPGAVDIHIHLREPSTNTSETIKNGTLSASHGGYTLVCDMPNNPGNPTWSVKQLREKQTIARRDASITTLFYAGAQPESDNIKELEGMSKAGAIGLKLYGAPTTGNHRDYSAKEFETIVAEWHRVAPNKPILIHAGKNNLEDFIKLICVKYNHRLHVCHVHSTDEVSLVDSYKNKKLLITCGVCPHHLLKTSHETIGKGWLARMQPSLPTQKEAESLISLLAEGKIDVIESDYAPHDFEAKLKAEKENPHGIHTPEHTTCFGVPGIEHIIPILISMVRKEILPLYRLVDAIHTKPIEILGLDKKMFDPNKNYSIWDVSEANIHVIAEESIKSGSGWSPYVGYIAGGRLSKLVSGGKIIYDIETTGWGKSQHSFYDTDSTYDDNFDNGPTLTGKEVSYKDTTKPKYTFLGHKINSPFGIAAGPLLNSKYIKYAFDNGFDVVCYKTQRSIEFEVNQFPNVLYVDVEGDLTSQKASKPILGLRDTNSPIDLLTVTNSFGNPSRGPKFWVEDLKKALSFNAPGKLIIMSVVGSISQGFTEEEYWNDFAHTAKLASDAGAPIIEINLSCPNVSTEGILCYNKTAVTSICKKVKESIGDKPLVAKFGYFSKEQQELLEAIMLGASPYLSAMSFINTIPAPIVNEYGEQALPGPNRLKSGVCGHSIKWAGIDMVKRANSIRKKHKLKIELIGIGGVMNADDFHDYIDSGADLVQSATGAMWNPELAKEIKDSL